MKKFNRRLGLCQKTCWYFKQKVMSAMKSSGDHPLKGRVEVDETAIGGQEKGVRERKNESKKLVVVAIEHVDKGISRMYAKVVQHSSSKELGEFMKLISIPMKLSRQTSGRGPRCFGRYFP